jgi:uncharacterized protein YwqG
VFLEIEGFDDMLEELGLAAYAEPIKESVKPAIRLGLQPADPALMPIGSSRFGGRPDLPEGTPWPRDEFRPLRFLLQFRIADINETLGEVTKAKDGLLSFFYGQDSGDDTVHFIHTPATELPRLKRLDPPQDLQVITPVFRPKPVFIASFNEMLPDLVERDEDLPNMTEEQQKCYHEELCHTRLEFGTEEDGEDSEDVDFSGGTHQLFGWPTVLQGAPAEELDGDPGEWLLLMQIESCDLLKLEVLDGGCLYWFMKPDAFAEGDFSVVRSVMQFH